MFVWFPVIFFCICWKMFIEHLKYFGCFIVNTVVKNYRLKTLRFVTVAVCLRPDICEQSHKSIPFQLELTIRAMKTRRFRRHERLYANCGLLWNDHRKRHKASLCGPTKDAFPPLNGVCNHFYSRHCTQFSWSYDGGMGEDLTFETFISTSRHNVSKIHSI